MAAKIVTHVEEKVRENSAPWLTCAAAMPVALVTHAAWGGDPVMQELLAGSGVVLTGWTWHTWSRRHEHTRALATLIAGAATGWTALATALPPWTPGMAESWFLGTTLLSVMWNTRHLAHKPAAESDRTSAREDGLTEAVGGSLKGSKVRNIKAKLGRVEADIQLSPGETVDGVQMDRGRIASVAKVGTEEVSVIGEKGRADRLKLVFQANSTLEQAVRWKGPSAPGKSIADAPLRIGERADGSPLELWIVGKDDDENPRSLPHTLVTGMTGSGKTETVKTAIIDMRSRTDVVPVVGDPAKFAQSFGEIADMLGIAAVNKQQCAQLIRNLPGTIAYRAELLGNLVRSDGGIGYPQWEPECWTEHGIPLVFIDIEEATDMVDEDMDEPLRKARSVGLPLSVSLQVAVYRNLARETRGQFANALAHGCKEDQDARFALSSATREAGADPTKWGADSPGSLYAELIGTPVEKWPVEARNYRLTREEKQAEKEASRATWATLDPGTAMVLGRGIPVPDAKITAMLPPVPAGVPATAYPAGMAMLHSLAGGTTEEPEAPAADLTRISTDEGDMDITQKLAPPTGSPVGLRSTPRKSMSTEDARALVEQRIDVLEASGRMEVGYADLADLTELTGRRRNWVYDELHRLVESGRLREGASAKPPYLICGSGRVLQFQGHGSR
jgi:hypothetical protein